MNIWEKLKNLFNFNYAKDILNSRTNIIFIIKDNKIKDVNNAFLNFFGFSDINEFKKQNKKIYQFFEEEEGYLYGKEWLNKVLNNPNYQYKIKIKKDNKKYIFKVDAAKIRNQIIVTFTDITKIMIQEKKLKDVNQLLEQYKKAVDLLLIVSKTDTKGIITYVNDKFCEISGYSREELIGKPHNIVRHPDMPKGIFRDMWNTIKRGELWIGFIKNRRKDGSFYWVDTGIMPIKNHKGEIIEFIALRTDITYLIEARKKAQEAEKAKGMFLANMSHEIRTPLNAVLGFTQLLAKDETIPDKAKKYISVINSSANTLLRIINDILDLSKIESGKLEIDKKPFNPKESFKNIIELFRAKAEEKNIKYVAFIDKNLPECIVSDEHRLKQVLANLIGNAIKFTPEKGEIDVSIKVLERNDKKCNIEFFVKDSGIGIAKDKQKKIFEAFSQEDGSITRDFGGTGLGLTISSKIIKELGGEIKLESEKNQGSKFYFELEFDVCKENFSKKEIKHNKYEGKILIAEDDKVNQYLMKEIFDSLGISIDLVSNGLEAVEKIKDNKYDLIFLDINMPKMGGVEALKKIKHLSDTPVVALSANAFKEDREKYLKEGFDGYVSKPVDIEELQKILDKFLNSNYIAKVKKELNLCDESLNELLNIYFETVKKDLDELKDAVYNLNLQKIMHLAHKIKGSSANLKFEHIASIASLIEKKAKEKDIIFDYKEHLNKLIKFIDELKRSYNE